MARQFLPVRHGILRPRRCAHHQRGAVDRPGGLTKQPASRRGRLSGSNGVLVANLGSNSVDASAASKGSSFVCPNCEEAVLLHRGPIKIPHFQHKSKNACDHGVGETELHRSLKLRLCKAWYGREKIEASIEKRVNDSFGAKRFLDVWIRSPKGRDVAIEIVHQNDGLEGILEKNYWLLSRQIAPIWISVIRAGQEEIFATKSQGLVVERYIPSAFEKWAHGLTFGELYLALSNGIIVCAKFEDHFLVREETTYFDENEREHRTNDGGWYKSKKFRNLKILWKRGPTDLNISFQQRNLLRAKNYEYPQGVVGRLVPR